MEATVIDPTTTESTPETPAISRITREGLKGLFKAQNILLEFAAEQNAIAFKAVRERIKPVEAAPANALINSVEEIFEGIVSMQKSIVDLGAERLERGAIAEEEAAPVKEKRSFPSLPLGELLRKNFETTVEAQREVLGLVEKQSKLGVKAADEFTRFTAGKTLKGLASMAKESIDNVIGAQGRLIDLAARQGKDAIEVLTRSVAKGYSKDLARHAEEGIENFRLAQKRLLDVAGELNERSYGRAEAKSEETAPSKLASRVQSGIERVIKSQNEMLDAGLRAVNRSKTVQN